MAGIVLTIGMAVDANVLIFDRIREEQRGGKTFHASIESGYANAMSAIFDANITTFIVAFLLFSFGSGPIKGFAVTLMAGIAAHGHRPLRIISYQVSPMEGLLRTAVGIKCLIPGKGVSRTDTRR